MKAPREDGVRKPDAGNLHVRFDEGRGWRRSWALCLSSRATPPTLLPLCEPTVKIWNQTGPLVMKPRVEELAAGGRTHTKPQRHKERSILIDLPRSRL